VLHGPAAALRIESVDPEIAAAVRWHTIGHPELGTLGAALFLADYLEPGRGHAPERRSALRARMPRDLPEVLREVVRERLIRTLEQGRVLREEGVRWWNRLSEEAA
ncbi:MAG: hypothetical protein M3409_06355, partial [Gemmatimonadota bacterium]|nr:hypothetical protein [Gemmatimonadota bacterium]